MGTTSIDRLGKIFEREGRFLCNGMRNIMLPGCKISEMINREFRSEGKECEIDGHGYITEDNCKPGHEDERKGLRLVTLPEEEILGVKRHREVDGKPVLSLYSPNAKTCSTGEPKKHFLQETFVGQNLFSPGKRKKPTMQRKMEQCERSMALITKNYPSGTTRTGNPEVTDIIGGVCFTVMSHSKDRKKEQQSTVEEMRKMLRQRKPKEEQTPKKTNRPKISKTTKGKGNRQPEENLKFPRLSNLAQSNRLFLLTLVGDQCPLSQGLKYLTKLEHGMQESKAETKEIRTETKEIRTEMKEIRTEMKEIRLLLLALLLTVFVSLFR